MKKDENPDQGSLDFAADEKKQIAEKVEDKPLNIDMQRVAATLLLKAALEYRDDYIPHDVAQYKQQPVPTLDQAVRMLGYPKNISNKSLERKHWENVKRDVKIMEEFSKRVHKEVAHAKSRMDKNGADWIDYNATWLSKFMRQIIPAKNMEELYGLMIMYNAGQLDFMFENYRNKQKEEPTNEETDKTTASA